MRKNKLHTNVNHGYLAPQSNIIEEWYSKQQDPKPHICVFLVKFVTKGPDTTDRSDLDQFLKQYRKNLPKRVAEKNKAEIELKKEIAYFSRIKSNTSKHSHLKALHDYFLLNPANYTDFEQINVSHRTAWGKTHRILRELPEKDATILTLAFHQQSTNKFNSYITSLFFHELNPFMNINLFWLTLYLTKNNNINPALITKDIIENKKIWKERKQSALKVLQGSLQVYCKHCDNYFSSTKTI